MTQQTQEIVVWVMKKNQKNKWMFKKFYFEEFLVSDFDSTMQRLVY